MVETTLRGSVEVIHPTEMLSTVAAVWYRQQVSKGGAMARIDE